MTEKAPKKKSTTLQVNRNRGGGKKRPDLFANLRNQEHPLDSLLPVDLEFEILDSQNINNGYPVTETLAIQVKNQSYPNKENLDSLIAKEEVWIAKEPSNLDSLIAKKKTLDSQKNQTTKEKGKWGKYDKSRSRKGIFLRTDDELTKQFKKFCIDHTLEFAQATELAWQRFMESLAIQKAKGLDSLIATNNIITSLSKTRPNIIKLYLAYNCIFNTQTKWKISDDKVGLIFNNADIRLIEIGIIQTQGELFQLNESGEFQKKDKNKIINAFSYYRQKIEANLIYDDEQMIETMLKIHQLRWQKITGKEIDLSFLNE